MKRLLAWTVLLVFAGICHSAERSAPPSEPSPAHKAMHHLDIDHPTLTQPITETGAAHAKFVEVHIEHVENPALAAISFSVAFQMQNQKLPLGSFSPYPPDHPGVFIVPTQGKIQTGGLILITMENPDDDQRLRVTIGAIKLLTQPRSFGADHP
jgi:hypothetical protein